MQIMISEHMFMAFFSVIDGPMDKKPLAPGVEHCFSNRIGKLHGIKILFVVEVLWKKQLKNI
mgnify:CR=1 FL=1